MRPACIEVGSSVRLRAVQVLPRIALLLGMLAVAMVPAGCMVQDTKPQPKLQATVASAESCTGGLIGKRLTDVPGSSAAYLGGVIAYANAVKVSMLGVEPAILEAHGSVSEPVARAMAEGVRSRLGARFGVATTGIAGPDGGSAEKPVGLVYIGLSGPEGTTVDRWVLPGDRELIRTSTAVLALDAVRRALRVSQA